MHLYNELLFSFNNICLAMIINQKELVINKSNICIVVETYVEGCLNIIADRELLFVQYRFN